MNKTKSKANRTPRQPGSKQAQRGRSQPLYKKIKLDVTRALSRASLDPDAALPTERQLAQRYGASVGTVRRAMDELVAEHVVVRQQGRGTFLARFSPERMLNRFWRVFRKDGSREIPIVQTVAFDVQSASDEVATALGLDPGDSVYRVVNVLLLGGNPVLLDDVQLPETLFKGMTEREFVARDTTMYGFYQERFGVSVFRVVDRLGAVAADSKTARRLSVPVFTPLLTFTRVAYAFGDRPVEYRRTWIHTFAYEYRNEIGDAPVGRS